MSAMDSLGSPFCLFGDWLRTMHCNAIENLISKHPGILFCMLVFVTPKCSCGQYADLPYCTREAQVQALAATVRVSVDNACGSGFIFFQNGRYAYIMTAAHVVDSNPPWIRLERFYTDHNWPSVRETYSAKIVHLNTTSDVAVLRCSIPGLQLPVLRIARELQLPFDGFSVGCGNSRPAEITGRRVESAKLNMAFRSCLIAASPVAEGGQSGGPLVDRHGEVIGVCVLNKDGKVWFSSLHALHEALDTVKLTRCYSPTGPLREITFWIVAVKIVLGLVGLVIADS